MDGSKRPKTAEETITPPLNPKTIEEIFGPSDFLKNKVNEAPMTVEANIRPRQMKLRRYGFMRESSPSQENKASETIITTSENGFSIDVI